MSSRRTRKNSRKNSRISRSRTQRQLDPLSQIFLRAPTRKFLTPIESAEKLVKKAADLIKAGTELPKPTGNKKLKKLNNPQKKSLRHIKIKQRRKNRERERKNKRNALYREIQRQFNPNPPSQSPKIQKSRPGRKRTIVPKPPSKSQSKTQKSRPTARTIRTTRKIPQKPSQKKSNFVNKFGPKGVKKRLDSSKRPTRTRKQTVRYNPSNTSNTSKAKETWI